MKVIYVRSMMEFMSKMPFNICSCEFELDSWAGLQADGGAV